MKRAEAISVIKALLDTCKGIDGHSIELAPPNNPNDIGYQIITRGALDEKTRNCIQDTLAKYRLAYQIGNMWRTKRSANKDPDTFIIYRPRK